MVDSFSCWHLAWGRPHPTPLPGPCAYGHYQTRPLSDMAQLLKLLQPQRDAVVLVSVADDAAATALLGAHGADLHAVGHGAALVAHVGGAMSASTALALTRAGALAVIDGAHPAADAPELLTRALRLAQERHRLLREARRAWGTDLTTGLFTEAPLREHLAHLVALREREPAAMALLLVDVRGIDEMAERAGAESAQVLRRKVAVRMRACLRASDVVAIAGPNRFWLLLSWLDDADDAVAVAEKIGAALARRIQVAGQDAPLASRIGMARYPDDAVEVDALMRAAVLALEGSAWLSQADSTRRPDLGDGEAANDGD